MSSGGPRTPEEWAQEFCEHGRAGLQENATVADLVRAALAARDAEVLPVLREACALFDHIKSIGLNEGEPYSSQEKRASKAWDRITDTRERLRALLAEPARQEGT